MHLKPSKFLPSVAVFLLLLLCFFMSLCFVGSVIYISLCFGLPCFTLSLSLSTLSSQLNTALFLCSVPEKEALCVWCVASYFIFFSLVPFTLKWTPPPNHDLLRADKPSLNPCILLVSELPFSSVTDYGFEQLFTWVYMSLCLLSLAWIFDLSIRRNIKAFVS